MPMSGAYINRKRKTPTLASSLSYKDSKETPCITTGKYAMICKELQTLSLLVCITQTEREIFYSIHCEYAMRRLKDLACKLIPK